MGRLKFDVSPINRDEGAHGTREENDAWARRCWANWGRKGEPRACDCGYFSDDWLVTCDEAERVHCRKNLRKRLEYGARQDHERALRKKREFPGPPHDGKGTGWCRWCGVEIINPKTGKRHHLRTWCPSGECLKAYNLHTFHIAQRRYLTARDGEGCKLCGSPDTEVDHVIPLGAAWEAFPEADRRRWFFSPANLQLLCKGGCHVAKSKTDVAFIKACQQNGPGWAKSEVLRRLNAAGLLRIRKDESCCA